VLATKDKRDPLTARERRARVFAERAKADWTKAHNVANSYGLALRKFAEQITLIIEHFASVDGTVAPEDMPKLNEALRRYTVGIQPWAQRTASRMLEAVNRQNLTAWRQHAAHLSFELRRELAEAPIGDAVDGLLAQQVGLITSLPMEAAQRVHEASLEAITVGSRYPDRTAEVEAALEAAHPDATRAWLRNRATLIARTETARAQSVLTQARAEHVGSTHYVWRTAGDWKTRPSHKKLDGSVQAWSEPPLCDPPDHHAHPGSIWNCRCVSIPIIGEAA